MLKYLICGAVAFGAFHAASGAQATGVIVNGQTYSGGTHTVTYPQAADSTYCCGQNLELQDTGVIVSAPAATHYESAPVADSGLVYIDQPAAVQPATYTVPAVTAPAPQPVTSYAVPAAPAPHAKRGWSSKVYVGARGGWTRARDSEFDLVPGQVTNKYDNAGYTVAALVGWGGKVQNSIGYRLELEGGYSSVEIDKHTLGANTFTGANAFGDTNVLYGFANAYLDIPVAQRVNAIVGGGVGLGRIEFDGHGINGGGGNVTAMDDEDTAFGYHLDAGVSYDVTNQLSLEAMYRYTSFVDAELTATDGTSSDVDLDSHNVLIGARYGF